VFYCKKLLITYIAVRRPKPNGYAESRTASGACGVYR